MQSKTLRHMAASPAVATSLCRRLVVSATILPRRPKSAECSGAFDRLRHFASRAEQARSEAALKKAQRDADIQKEGAVPVGLFFAVGGGLWFGTWYSGFFESNEAGGSWSGDFAKGASLVAFLKSRDIKVVAFELDGVMRPTDKFCRGGVVMRHEIGEYVNGASHDFIEAANFLARHDLYLAVATYSDSALCELPGRKPKTHVAGAELAKLLISKRCPEAASHFSDNAIIGYDARLHGDKPKETSKHDHLIQIALAYGVTRRQIAVVDIQQNSLQDGDEFVSVFVEEPKDGFKFEDFAKIAKPTISLASPGALAASVSAFFNSK